MSMLDSEAVFSARAREMGLVEDEINRIAARGWHTMGRFAFCVAYTPGQADEANLVRLGAVVTGTGAADPPEDRMPLVRRLYFEAYTLAAADLRSKVDRRDDDAPRRLALPERTQRNSQQAVRLNGIDLVGDLEVSHALIDAVVQMHGDNQLRYLRWEECRE